MTKRALITGITGQDGRHLAELLLQKDYEVFGLLRGQHNPKRLIVERLDVKARSLYSLNRRRRAAILKMIERRKGEGGD